MQKQLFSRLSNMYLLSDYSYHIHLTWIWLFWRKNMWKPRETQTIPQHPLVMSSHSANEKQKKPKKNSLLRQHATCHNYTPNSPLSHRAPRTFALLHRAPRTSTLLHRALRTFTLLHRATRTSTLLHRAPRTFTLNIHPVTPGAAHIHPVTPGDAHIHPVTPGDAHIHLVTPGDAHIHPVTPGAVNIHPVTPGAAHIHPATLGAANIHPVTPGAANIHPEHSPCYTGRRAHSPCYTGRRGKNEIAIPPEWDCGISTVLCMAVINQIQLLESCSHSLACLPPCLSSFPSGRHGHRPKNCKQNRLRSSKSPTWHQTF